MEPSNIYSPKSMHGTQKGEANILTGTSKETLAYMPGKHLNESTQCGVTGGKKTRHTLSPGRIVHREPQPPRKLASCGDLVCIETSVPTPRPSRAQRYLTRTIPRRQSLATSGELLKHWLHSPSPPPPARLDARTISLLPKIRPLRIIPSTVLPTDPHQTRH